MELRSYLKVIKTNVAKVRNEAVDIVEFSVGVSEGVRISNEQGRIHGSISRVRVGRSSIVVGQGQ